MAPPRHPLHNGLTRRNQYNAAGPLACARRRIDAATVSTCLPIAHFVQMTSSTKPDKNNISQRRQKRTELLSHRQARSSQYSAPPTAGQLGGPRTRWRLATRLAICPHLSEILDSPVIQLLDSHHSFRGVTLQTSWPRLVDG